jgi:hypothetical protein
MQALFRSEADKFGLRLREILCVMIEAGSAGSWASSKGGKDE